MEFQRHVCFDGSLQGVIEVYAWWMGSEVTTTKVHAVLQPVLCDLRGGTFRQHPRVLVATLRFPENSHRSLHILHVAMFQVLRGAYIPVRVLSTTENQEGQELLVEIQQ